MSGFFFGTLIAACVMLLLCNAGEFSPFMAKLHAMEQVIVTALISPYGNEAMTVLAREKK